MCTVYIYKERDRFIIATFPMTSKHFVKRPASISFQNQQDLAGSLVSIFWNVVGKSEGHLTQVTCTSRSRNSKLQFLSTPGLVGWPEVEKAIPLWLQFSRCQLFVNTLATCWKKTWNTQIPICVLHGPDLDVLYFVCDLAGMGPLCQPAKAGHMRSLPGQLPQTQHNMAQCSPSWQIMRPKTEKMSNIEISHNI